MPLTTSHPGTRLHLRNRDLRTTVHRAANRCALKGLRQRPKKRVNIPVPAQPARVSRFHWVLTRRSPLEAAHAGPSPEHGAGPAALPVAARRNHTSPNLIIVQGSLRTSIASRDWPHRHLGTDYPELSEVHGDLLRKTPECGRPIHRATYPGVEVGYGKGRRPHARFASAARPPGTGEVMRPTWRTPDCPRKNERAKGHKGWRVPARGNARHPADGRPSGDRPSRPQLSVSAQ